jgi:hypothetical protein
MLFDWTYILIRGRRDRPVILVADDCSFVRGLAACIGVVRGLG